MERCGKQGGLTIFFEKVSLDNLRTYMEKYFTQEGLEKLKQELQHLKEVKRKEIAERLGTSIAFGDLSENFEYQEAKEAQAFLEGQILNLEDLVNTAVVVPQDSGAGVVRIGSTILVNTSWGKEKFMIVGAQEASPTEGKISADSPLGKALLEQQKGATVEVEAPRGKVKYKIVRID